MLVNGINITSEGIISNKISQKYNEIFEKMCGNKSSSIQSLHILFSLRNEDQFMKIMNDVIGDNEAQKEKLEHLLLKVQY